MAKNRKKRKSNKSYAIYSIEDKRTRTERFASYSEAYNFIRKKEGINSIKGYFKIILK